MTASVDQIPPHHFLYLATDGTEAKLPGIIDRRLPLFSHPVVLSPSSFSARLTLCSHRERALISPSAGPLETLHGSDIPNSSPSPLAAFSRRILARR